MSAYLFLVTQLAPDMADATAFVSAYPFENLELVLHGLDATPICVGNSIRRTCDEPWKTWFRKMPAWRLRPK